ncbi:unnamed protein product [Arabis nemorensis]|uniref:FAE domain-containing protein n=1 Tax=Arabis nemorensis TaxID=586526 RepID=A0A565AYZ2_9BRAS|nr:unnamed protein product [Arabis nemorensis]
MLVTNCLFRVGGAAILLSNKSGDRRRSKYKLLHTVRTHTGADNKSFRCVQQEDDEKGKTGVSLTKDITSVAKRTITKNIATLGPLVLPLSEKLLFFMTYIRKKFFDSKIKNYVPVFKCAIDHFCIHAGGRAVIDELEKSLNVEASRSTLHRFGNTSWYELAYTEAKGRMTKGNKAWQIALGSGLSVTVRFGWHCAMSNLPLIVLGNIAFPNTRFSLIADSFKVYKSLLYTRVQLSLV